MTGWAQPNDGLYTSSFIGRRGKLAELRTKLTESRLVSLVGPGGVGKTRLALRAATDLGRAFRGGAWLVELAEIQDSGLVPNAVMAALDLRDRAATGPLPLVLSYLREKHVLLVLDNCEHVLGPAARLVSDVLRAAPDVRVIATSREPLSVSGEHVIPVPTLELPGPDAAGALAQLRRNEAVTLFCERAAAASGRFELTEANQAAVVGLCRRLDGVPLAIELAAVRTRVLTPEQVLDRLSDRFGLLTGGSRAALPRHQTLRTTIDWSHNLLETGEATVLRRLSVFAGRFTLEDVEAVCAPENVAAASPLDLLASLVDKSLVTRQDAGDIAYYRLHETMREYAGLKLREACEHEALELRCAEYYRATCRRSTAQARFRLLEWLAWMDVEIDNVRLVLRRCRDRHDVEGGADLATSLGWYWITRAITEGVRWLDELLVSPGARPEAHARAHFLRGFLAVLQSDPAAATAALDRALAAAGAAGQLDVLSQSLSMASIAANMVRDRASAERLLGDAEIVASGLDDTPTRLMLLQARAYDGLFTGDIDAVRSSASEGTRLCRELGDLYVLENMLMNMGMALLMAGDLRGATPLLIEALRIARDVDDRYALYCLLDALGCHAAASGQVRLASRLLGAAATVRASTGARVVPFLAQPLARAEASVVAALGAARFKVESAAGARLDRDAAVALALGEPGRVSSADLDSGRAGLLGKREVEVARLVADGLSNKEIGARLFIWEYTVDSHVRSILNKLGVNSRVQVAAWISSSDPGSTD